MRIQDGKEHVVHTDPDCQHDDRGRREAAIACQQTASEPDVLEERVEERQAPLIAVLGLQLIDATKRAPRRRASLSGTQPLRDEIARQQIEMGLDLVVQAGVASRTNEDVQHSRDEHPSVGEERHQPSSSRRLTIDTVRAQSCDSAASCRRPFAVIE
jgi:hypothetical protein